jgi:hypothetical protein
MRWRFTEERSCPICDHSFLRGADHKTPMFDDPYRMMIPEDLIRISTVLDMKAYGQEVKSTLLRDNWLLGYIATTTTALNSIKAQIAAYNADHGRPHFYRPGPTGP